MSNYIVLVKQVPDVTRITDNVFDPETGNLIRSRLVNVINQLDAQALAFARRMKEISGDLEARIICLSMGPPSAAEVLRYGLSRGADLGVLLTDKALGGADTPATANPLAHAIRKIKSEIFDESDDYYVVCGMQSVDGDTAQVPPQVAEELGISCLPYATGVEFVDGRFRFKQIIAGGAQIVELCRLPTVITIAKYDYPLYASFAATRRARRQALIQWGVDDVKPSSMGAAGSKTRVIKVFPPAKTKRQCRQLQSVSELVEVLGACLAGEEANKTVETKDDAAPAGYLLPARRASWFDRSFESSDKERAAFKELASALVGLGISAPAQLAAQEKMTGVREKLRNCKELAISPKMIDEMLLGLTQQKTAYSGEIWVMAEHQGGEFNALTFELTGKARELADSLEVAVGLALVGSGVRNLARQLIAAGADKVYLIEDPLLGEFDPISYRKVVAELFRVYQPQIFLFGATPQGRVLAPMVAYRVGCGLTADCTDLTLQDLSRKGQLAVMMQTRPALGGNVMATICSRNSSCQMATARSGVMRRRAVDPERRGELVELAVELSQADLSLKIIERLSDGGAKIDFAGDIIVGGGKGLGPREDFTRLLDELTAALATRFRVKSGRGGSRAAVEQGFIERAFQVGQTGTAIAPKVYLAVGISGAIQHMIGVANSQTIIAINADPQAPIFKQCDYFMVGRAEGVIPELINICRG